MLERFMGIMKMVRNKFQRTYVPVVDVQDFSNQEPLTDDELAKDPARKYQVVPEGKYVVLESDDKMMKRQGSRGLSGVCTVEDSATVMGGHWLCTEKGAHLVRVFDAGSKEPVKSMIAVYSFDLTSLA